MAGVTTYTCIKCRPIDTKIIEAYEILTNTSKAVSQQEADRVAAENARVSAEEGRTTVFNADHDTAVADHGIAAEDQGTAGADHATAVSDHDTAAEDHTLAVSDHQTAGEDHSAVTTATSRANEAAAAAEHMVDIHRGPEGKSAYEVAVDEGFVGTEDEWLESLNGTGINRVEQTETSIANGGTNKVRITLTDGTYYDIQIKNGSSSNGLFPTSSALEAACPSPKVGDYAFVGDGFPADIYVCETAGTWTDSGEDYDGDNVDLTDYAKKEELTQLEHKLIDYPIDSSSFPRNNVIIDGTGKWLGGSGTSTLVPITPGQSYKVTAKIANTTIGVLAQSSAGASGASVSFATGYTGRITVYQGSSYSFIAPGDAQTLYLRMTDSGGNSTAPEVYTGLDYAFPDIINKIEGTRFPVLRFTGKGYSYSSGVAGDGLMLKGHNYRLYPFGVDITGQSYEASLTMLILTGVDDNGASTQIFKITRGSGTFTPPSVINYYAEKNIYNLRFDGRNKPGAIVSLLIEDLGETQVPSVLTLEGADSNYTSAIEKITLYKGEYRLIINQWDTSTITDGSLPVIVLAGKDGNGNSVVLIRYTKSDFINNSHYIDFKVGETLTEVYLSGRGKSSTTGVVSVTQHSELTDSYGLSFPVMGCGNKMLSLPITRYAHLPKIIETSNFIFTLYSSSRERTTEAVGNYNDIVLCVISKATGEQWYETIFDCKHPETIDGQSCLYCHTINMIDVSANAVVISTGCVNGSKFLFINKTYTASTRVLSAVAKSTISYGGNSYDLNLRNYIQMANSVYSLSIEESDMVANSADIWNPSKYDDNGTTKYIALFSFKTSSADETPYIMMNSTDAKNWQPMFLLTDELNPGETSAVVSDNKIYITNRIGGSFVYDVKFGQFFGVCDMSGLMLKQFEKINVQRTRPCEIVIGGSVYVVYNDGNNSGKYWGRTKIIIAKVETDYSLTTIKSFYSPFGINYPSACDHNGAMLLVYAEDMRGYNAVSENATTDIAIAQLFDLTS